MAAAVVHIYGLDRFSDELFKANRSIGELKHSWLALCWKYSVPFWTLLLVCLGIAAAMKTSFLGDSNGQPYPGWAVPVGWIITMCPVVALITATVCGSSDHSRRQSGSGGAMSSSYELSNSRSAYVM